MLYGYGEQGLFLFFLFSVFSSSGFGNVFFAMALRGEGLGRVFESFSFEVDWPGPYAVNTAFRDVAGLFLSPIFVAACLWGGSRCSEDYFFLNCFIHFLPSFFFFFFARMCYMYQLHHGVCGCFFFCKFDVVL
jgi:hypothetical protein